MKALLWSPLILLFWSSCSLDAEDDIYTGRQTEYALHQTNQSYPYSGKVLFREMAGGEIEITIQLVGERGDHTYFFPAHLHHRAYGTSGSPMAAMLSPVNHHTLASTTVITQLSDGTPFLFDDIGQFDGHVKVHLASEGPDYEVILVAGNMGSNAHLPI